MSHVIRLIVLTVLVFVCMSAYSFLPNEWNSQFELSALSERQGSGEVPRGIEIFISPHQEDDAEGEEEVTKVNRFVKRRNSKAAENVRRMKKARERERDGQRRKEELKKKKKKEKQKPPPAEPEPYVRIKKGDTLSSIIRDKFNLTYTSSGYTAMLKEIKRKNPGLNPKKLSIGRKVVLPRDKKDRLKTEEKQKKTLKFKRYRVNDGDTLYSIAEQFYNDGGRWRELWKINRSSISNYKRIKKGIFIKIPLK